MADLSYFESRTGKVTCSSEDVYNFVTDIRNFERFIPQGTIENWAGEKESCSFRISMLGNVMVRIAEKVKFTKVEFTGDALKKNDFTIVLNIIENGNNRVEVKVALHADLNPMLKMMASKPIGKFLEMLVSEMEVFRDWKDLRV